MANKKKKSKVVDTALEALGTGSDMTVAGALRALNMMTGRGPASAIAKKMGKKTAGKTRTGRALSDMGVSDNFVETMEGTRRGRKAPLDSLHGFSRGGQVQGTKFKGTF